MFSREQFGQRLYEMRKKNHETQADLAALFRTGRTTVSEMESGKKTTTAEKIALICEHYHICSDYLLGLTDDPSPR